jgi:hypothetical protein
MNNEAFVELLYRSVLRREPDLPGVRHFADLLAGGRTPLDILQAFHERRDFLSDIKLFVRPGHFYSPVVDPKLVATRHRELWPILHDSLPGIRLDDDAMKSLWNSWLPAMRSMPFFDERTPEHRYHYLNNWFTWADAAVYSAILQNLRPRQVLEVGSGYTSALALDTIDRCKELPTQLITIEPNAERLRRVLRPSDLDRLQIREQELQSAPDALFTSLCSGDILFIDSTHVLKSHSDVHEVLFRVLPLLAPGVYVHFHDVFYPFEYPPEWVIDQNRSWNEVYALRAFLTNNFEYSIVFFSDYFRRRFPELASDESSPFSKGGWSSLWLRKHKQ